MPACTHCNHDAKYHHRGEGCRSTAGLCACPELDWREPTTKSDKKIFRPEALALVELLEEDVIAAVRLRIKEMGAPVGSENWRKFNATQQGKLALIDKLRKEIQSAGPYEVIAIAEGTAL